MECSKLIIQAGIKRVVFGEYYRMHDGVDLLCRAGIEVVHLWLREGEYEAIQLTAETSESHYQEVESFIASLTK
jgi:deoxycytidylate deaminase